MNKTAVQTTGASLVALLAGYLAGAHVGGLDAATWTTLLTYVAGAAAIVWPLVATRLKALKNTVGNSGAIVVTDAATANSLPNNPNVIAATPEVSVALNKAASR